MTRPIRHRVVATALFAAAAVLAVAAFASAVTHAPEAGDSADAAARADAAPATADSFAARAALALDVLGRSVARDVALALPAPESAATPAPPAASRGLALDGRGVGVPVAASLELALGLGASPSPTVAEAPSARAAAATLGEAPAAPGAALLAAAAVAAAGALAWFWPTVKEAFGRAVLAPLYAHITRAEVFENGVREKLFQSIKTEPGISASELAARSGLSWGTTIYHLDVLEQTQMVVSVKDGRYRRYFENGGAVGASREVVSALRNTVSAAVAETVRERPGLTQKELARSLGLSPQALHWHAERLLKAGVVSKVRDGRVVRFYRAA